jgi:hypothetical protein
MSDTKLKFKVYALMTTKSFGKDTIEKVLIDTFEAEVARETATGTAFADELGAVRIVPGNLLIQREGTEITEEAVVVNEQ